MPNPTKLFLSALLFSILLPSCKKKEDSPTIKTVTNDCPDCTIVPTITFSDIRVNTTVGSSYKYDSITISLQYKDLDGNLGQPLNNLIQPNYICEVDYKDAGIFKHAPSRDTSNGSFLNRNGFFTSLPTQGGGSVFSATGTAKMGTLHYGLRTFWMFSFPDSASVTLKFRIHVEDNDGNKSNTIETPEVIVHNYELL